MSIERNIIFIYPLSKTLKDLKDEIDKQGEAVLYELDSVNEYAQIIGVVEHSITFSSDIKKTESYLKKCKKLLKKPTNKNYLIQEKNVNPRMFAKYQRAGLNEVVLEGAAVKSLLYKINMFFSPFEQAAKKEEEAKNKAVMGSMTIKKDNQNSNQEKEEYNSNERLRVEKTVDLDDNAGELKTSKKHSGFDVDLMFNSGTTSNLQLKKPKTESSSFMNSPFDRFQRKKVALFEAKEIEKKMKKASFEPLTGELKKSSKKTVDLNPAGELARKKARQIEFEEAEFKKKKVHFEENLEELKKKKGVNLDLAEEDLKKKKVDFNELLTELERKRGATFEETELGRKKKKNLDDFYNEMQKKKKSLDLLEEDLKKKKVDFQEIDLEMGKKRKQLDDVTLDLKKKRAILDELEALSKKKGALLDDVDGLEKKRKDFEEVLNKANIKKLKFPDLEDPLKKKKGADFEAEEFDKKKGKNFEATEFERKKMTFEEVELDLGQKRKKFEEVHELNKKDGKFDEIEDEGREHSTLILEQADNEYKRAGFEEVKRERGFQLENTLNIKQDINLDTSMGFEEQKEYEEEVLDYGQFKKDKKQGKLLKEQEEEERRKKKELEDLLDLPEYKYFENISFGLEYLIIHNDFLLKENTTTDEFFKFIHFALLRAFSGDVSFYLVVKHPEEEGKDYLWKCLYSGHRARKNPILENDFERYEAINIQDWLRMSIPTWRDETYQEEINEFVYPYFEDGVLLGIAVAHFKDTVKSHDDASKVELMSLCLKGLILNEKEVQEKSA